MLLFPKKTQKNKKTEDFYPPGHLKVLYLWEETKKYTLLLESKLFLCFWTTLL